MKKYLITVDENFLREFNRIRKKVDSQGGGINGGGAPPIKGSGGGPNYGLRLAYLRIASGTGSNPASFLYDLYANKSDATAGTGTPLFTGVGLSTALKRLPVNYLQADDGSECWYRVLPNDSGNPEARIVIFSELPDTSACADTTGGSDAPDEGDGGV